MQMFSPATGILVRNIMCLVPSLNARQLV